MSRGTRERHTYRGDIDLDGEGRGRGDECGTDSKLHVDSFDRQSVTSFDYDLRHGDACSPRAGSCMVSSRAEPAEPSERATSSSVDVLPSIWNVLKKLKTGKFYYHPPRGVIFFVPFFAIRSSLLRTIP